MLLFRISQNFAAKVGSCASRLGACFSTHCLILSRSACVGWSDGAADKVSSGGGVGLAAAAADLRGAGEGPKNQPKKRFDKDTGSVFSLAAPGIPNVRS